MEYEPEFNTFAFDEQSNDLLDALIFASISSLPSPSHEAPPSVPSSSSLKLKPLPNTLKSIFLGLNKSFPMIITNDLNSDQETEVLDLLRKRKRL